MKYLLSISALALTLTCLSLAQPTTTVLAHHEPTPVPTKPPMATPVPTSVPVAPVPTVEPSQPTVNPVQSSSAPSSGSSGSGTRVAVCHNEDDPITLVQSVQQRNVQPFEVSKYLANGLDWIMTPGGDCGPSVIDSPITHTPITHTDLP